MTNNPILSNFNGDEGVQFYQDMISLIEDESAMAKPEASQEFLGYSTTTPTTATNVMSGVGAGPRGGELKPIRRRLRASKKAPTTILKANTNNFRALVQQFTGCPTPTTTSISFAARKGPVSLSFGPSTYAGQVSTAKSTTSSGPLLLPNYGYANDHTYSSSNYIIGQQPQIHYQQSLAQTGDRDHGLVPVNHYYDANIVATNDGFATNSIELHDRVDCFGSGDYDNNTLFP